MLTGIAVAVVMLGVVGALGGFRSKPGGPDTVKPGAVVHQGLFDVQVTDARAGQLKINSFDPGRNLLLLRMRVTNLGRQSYGITTFMDGLAAEPKPGKYLQPELMDSQGYIDGQVTSTIHPRLPITVQLGASGESDHRVAELELHAGDAIMSATIDQAGAKDLAVDLKQAYIPPDLVKAFARLTVASYAHNFDSYDGERFTIDPKVDTRGPDKLVKTQIAPSKGAPTDIAYRMRQSGGAWKVIDVYYKGSISELATRRSDFSSAASVPALVQKINALADKQMS